MTFVAICPNYWGKGETQNEALAAMVEVGGTRSRYQVYQLPTEAQDAYVDQLGTIRWTWPEGYTGSRIVDLELVAEHGIDRG